MKAVVNLTIAVLLIFAVSCRTVKTGEKITSSTDSSVHTEAKTESSVHQQSSLKNNITDNSVTSVNSSTVKTETEYSKPDSTGAQHPTKVTVTKTEVGNLTKNDVKTNIQINQKADSTGVNNSKSEVNQSEDKSSEATKAKKAKTPLWIWLPIAIISVGLVVLAYLFLKRFGLVK